VPGKARGSRFYYATMTVTYVTKAMTTWCLAKLGAPGITMTMTFVTTWSMTEYDHEVPGRARSSRFDWLLHLHPDPNCSYIMPLLVGHKRALCPLCVTSAFFGPTVGVLDRMLVAHAASHRAKPEPPLHGIQVKL